MIGKLVQTEITGNSKSLIGLSACCLLGLFLFVFASSLGEIAVVIPFTLVPLAVAGLYVYIRARRERRLRLLAQLPVTQLQIVLAEWCFTFLIILIPGITLLVAGLLYPKYTSLEALRYFFVAFCVLTTMLAALAIAQNIGKLPQPYVSAYQWLWILAVLAFLSIAPISAETQSFFFPALSEPNWPLISSFYAVSSLILMGTNIWLHQRAEDYLGN